MTIDFELKEPIYIKSGRIRRLSFGIMPEYLIKEDTVYIKIGNVMGKVQSKRDAPIDSSIYLPVKESPIALMCLIDQLKSKKK